MRKSIIIILFIGFVSLLISCANGGGSGRVYHHHHSYGPRWGDRVVVLPPGNEVEPAYEATPLPSGPDDMPDMGMPDIGDGGDDF